MHERNSYIAYEALALFLIRPSLNRSNEIFVNVNEVYYNEYANGVLARRVHIVDFDFMRPVVNKK